MTDPVSVLLIFVNEADLWFDAPLYEAIEKRLRELGVAGATDSRGSWALDSITWCTRAGCSAWRRTVP